MYGSVAPILAAFGFFLVIFGAVSIGIAVLYILTLRKALSRCAPQNRTTSPDSTWFLLIPLFQLGLAVHPVPAHFRIPGARVPAA